MKTVVVVVAHPDDETLWAGGLLQKQPGTHVLCCSVPAKDPQRIKDFFEACKMMRANPIVCAESLAANSNVLSLRVAQQIAANFSTIITHNSIGEYGHPQHIQVHEAMMELKSKDRQVLSFGYGLTTLGDAIDIEFKKKVLALYESRPNVFARQSAKFNLGVETFVNE